MTGETNLRYLGIRKSEGSYLSELICSNDPLKQGFGIGIDTLTRNYPSKRNFYLGSNAYQQAVICVDQHNEINRANPLDQILFNHKNVARISGRLLKSLDLGEVVLKTMMNQGWGVALESETSYLPYASINVSSDFLEDSNFESLEFLSIVYASAHLITSIQDARAGYLNFELADSDVVPTQARSLRSRVKDSLNQAEEDLKSFEDLTHPKYLVKKRNCLTSFRDFHAKLQKQIS